MSVSADGALTFAAPAKVNLYLHVTGRRADGFHTLDSLIAFAGVQDKIKVEAAEGLSLAVDGPFADGIPVGADNLVLKAALGLKDLAGVTAGAAITLTKRLPVASGLGGGSADAAAVLRALMRLWNVEIGEAALMDLAVGLGADVPMCLRGRAAFAGGIGEELTPAPALPEGWLVLVNPLTPVSTPEVFAARQGPYSEPARFTETPGNIRALAELLAARRNDLTVAAESLEPAIGRVLAALEACPGVLLSRMSGSGATCFGLFGEVTQATQAVMGLIHDHPRWWVKAASLEADATRLDR
ncbi:MAG: 4-(cytidine 5'-diphospho)-2-C-methyl-D-erythritol kinase [Rhodospirillales bacterium]|nr:4-(cytidine 5'-diphospho)-2-C-methyl-D-erythritol kinase [Rhodospirillales bacterium]